MSSAAAPHDPLQDRTLAVETPEHVSIDYPLAGLGSRFAALLLDLVLVGLLLLAPLIPVLIATRLGAFDGLVAALWIAYSFAVLWGYFFLHEAFRDGQTPGKRRLSIRVVMDRGQAITVEAAAIRNLVRVVDLMGFGLVGGLVMLVGRRAQRLGDVAASTVVVRELPTEFPDAAAVPADAAAPRLHDAAFAAVEKYVDRRDALEERVRDSIALELARRLFAVEPHRAGETADDYLVRFHAEERARRLAARLGAGAGSAAALSLLRVKRERWEEFRAIASRAAKRGLAPMDDEAVGDFAARYRELTADLARARTYRASPATVYALERLVGAGHNLLYRPARRSLRRAAGWVARGFPGLVRRRWLPISLAAALLYGPGVASYAWLRLHPELERQMVSGAMVARADEAPARRAAGSGYIDPPSLGHAFMSSAIISNNIQVSFLAFAGGAAAGIGTAAVLVINGLHLGSVLAVYRNREALDVIGVFVLPHGVIELTAICIAGGAGLWLGSGLLLPGRRRRLDAFAERGKEAVALIAGVCVLLVCAGFIEGFVSPARIPDAVKLAVAAAAALALFAWLATAGRSAPSGGVTAPRAA